MDVLLNLFLIVMGCLLVLFPKGFAKSMAGGWGQRYTETQLKVYRVTSMIVGIIFIVFGILRIIGIIK